MLLEEFTAKGPLIEEPDWNSAELRDTKGNWGVFDRARSKFRKQYCLFLLTIYDA